MSTNDFSTRLNQALDFAMSPTDPYGKAYEALKTIVESIEKSLNKGLPRKKSVRIEIEPGFQAVFGQQLRIIVRIPEKNFRDTLFRAYIPSEGFPIKLDLYGEEPEDCKNKQELEDKILAFLGTIRDRMTSYRDYAKT